MACPFSNIVLPDLQTDPDCLEIELTPPCRYICSLPNAYFFPKPILDYPVYLRNTISHPSHLKHIRTLSVPHKLSTFESFIKQGNRFYHHEDFDKSLECYEHAYGLFKFLELKKDSKLSEHFDVVSLETKSEQETDLKNKAIIQALKNLIHSFFKLKNFKEAIEAVKEALEIKPNDPVLLSLQVKIRLSDLSYKNLPKVLKTIKKIIKISEDFAYLLDKYNENLQKRKEIIDSIYNSIAKSYLKHNYQVDCEISTEKEFEHRIIEKMQEKYYEMIEFYLQNNKSPVLHKVREELKVIQMTFFKMETAFKINRDDQKFVDLVAKGKACDGIAPEILDSVKRVLVSMMFNEGKYNDQLLAYCMEKCTEEDRKKQKTVVKKSGWVTYLFFGSVPLVLAWGLYRM